MDTRKMAEKSLKIHKWTNFRPKLSLWHFVIEPVISNDEFVDDLVLYENYLISYSWILIKLSKSEDKRGKNYIHCKVLDRL